MNLIKLTPRLMALGAALVILVLGVSVHAMGRRAQQHKLEILNQSVNASGRTELQANVVAGQCDTGNHPNITGQYEIKKNASITPADATQIINARCTEAGAADTLRQAFGITPGGSGFGANMTDMTSIFMVAQISAKTSTQLTLQIPTTTPDETSGLNYTVTDDTKVFKAGASSNLRELQVGDLILPIAHAIYASNQGGDAIAQTIVGLVILPPRPELKWYSPAYRDQLTQIETCEGNPQDRCSFTGSIDFYPSGGGEANTVNPAFKQTDLPQKEIAGTITEINATYTKMKSSSGRIFRINFGSNPAADYNRDNAKHHNNDPVTVGDTLMVRYAEAANQHATTITQDHILNAVLMVEFAGKNKPIKQY